MAEQAVLDNTLTEAITKAVEVHDKEVAQQDQSDVVVHEAPSGEGKGEEKLKEDKEAEDQDTEFGKQLIQALRDPQKAEAVIDFLATKAGYTKQTIVSKDDVRDAKKDILGILETNLGDEFKFLAPKLAPAIKESLETLLADHISDIKTRIEKQELHEIQIETATTHTSLAREWFGSDEMPKEVITAMSEAMDEFPPTDPNMTADRYYRRIFSLVAGELGLNRKGSRNQGDRISRNREDSVARNLSSQDRGVTPSTSGNPRKLSLKDAVELAVQQVDQSSKK